MGVQDELKGALVKALGRDAEAGSFRANGATYTARVGGFTYTLKTGGRVFLVVEEGPNSRHMWAVDERGPRYLGEDDDIVPPLWVWEALSEWLGY